MLRNKSKRDAAAKPAFVLAGPPRKPGGQLLRWWCLASRYRLDPGRLPTTDCTLGHSRPRPIHYLRLSCLLTQAVAWPTGLPNKVDMVALPDALEIFGPKK